MNSFKIEIIISLIILIFTNGYSQTKITTDFKDYSLEIFETSNINNLDIRGNHAQINLLNWEKDSISVETSLEILSNKPNLSKEMLDEINIKVVTYSNTLQVKTTFTQDFNRTIPYKIIYNIFYPKEISLNIKNSNGQVNIAEISGKTIAELNYCDFKINGLSTDNDSIENDIKLNYCNGTLNKVGNTKITSNNSNIKIVSATHIKLASNYSIFDINNIESFNVNSTIDNIKIGQVSAIKLQATNATININKIGVESLFECKGGFLHINNSTNTLKKLTINNNNTKTDIKLSEMVSYTINGEIYKGKLIHPNLDKLQLIKDTDKISFNGVIGNNPQNDSKVIIFNTNQNVEFK